MHSYVESYYLSLIVSAFINSHKIFDHFDVLYTIQKGVSIFIIEDYRSTYNHLFIFFKFGRVKYFFTVSS
jgi:hypothetical protein